MNKKITIGISILLLIIIVGINISYASRSQNEKDFLKVNKEEISPEEILEITFDIASLEYNKFKISLNSNIDVKDVYTQNNENITIEDKDDAIILEIDKEKINLNQITLYYPISKDIKIGTKIQLTAKIIVNNEMKVENETNNNIAKAKNEINNKITTETENQKNTTNTENMENENNEEKEEIVKEITKIITVVEKNNENKEEENTNSSNDKKPENKQEMSNEEKSNSKQEQKNSNEKTSNNIDNQKISVSGSAKSSLSGTSINIENQATYNGSNNNYLEKLEVEGKEFNTSFNKENGTYFIDINNTNAINVTAIAEDSTAKVYITGNDNLESGNNKILISVTAENGDVRYYRIFVNCEEEIDET